MNMRNGRTGLAGIDTVIGNLLRGNRVIWMFINIGVSASNGAGKNNFVTHFCLCPAREKGIVLSAKPNPGASQITK